MLISHQWPVTTAIRLEPKLPKLARTEDLDPLLRRLQDALKCDYIVAVTAAANGDAAVIGSLGDGHQADTATCIDRLMHSGRSNSHCGGSPALRLAGSALEIAPAWPGERDVSALSLRVPAGAHPAIVIIAVRRAPRTPFSASDERTFQRYADWVADYVAMWWRLRDGEQRRTGLQSALDQVGLALIMLDRDGRTLGSNDAARLLLRAGDGLIAVGETLSCAALEDAVRLHAAIGHALVGPMHGARAPVLTVRRKRRRPLVIAVLRVAADPQPGETAIVLQIIEPDRDHDSAITASCTLFGFTGAEARLAKQLVGGATLAEAATVLRIQMPTARTYLKQAFAKSGTNRQAALVQVLLSSLVHTGADTVLTSM